MKEVLAVLAVLAGGYLVVLGAVMLGKNIDESQAPASNGDVQIICRNGFKVPSGSFDGIAATGNSNRYVCAIRKTDWEIVCWELETCR